MNQEQFQGSWNILKGKIKEKWGKLTDNDLTQINGKREILVGLLEKRYGITKEEIETQLHQLEDALLAKAGRTGGQQNLQGQKGPSAAHKNPSQKDRY